MSERLFTLRIDTTQATETAEGVQRLRRGLADRRPLHAEMAVEAERLTRQYVRGLDRHRSAERLGANPTGHLEKASASIESGHDAAMAFVRIPRATGLARAFGTFYIRPGSGKKYLTIPGARETYGKRVGEFPEGTFAFTIMAGRYPVLVFRETWSLAYWLRTSVTIEQDRTLLPSDQAFRAVARGAKDRYVRRLLGRGDQA